MCHTSTIESGPFRRFSTRLWKMHAYILLGLQWCAICIFIFLEFYNFIIGIMCIYTVFLKNLRPMFLYLTYLLVKIFVTGQCICLNKLVSKVWKKNCPNWFIYKVQSSKKVGVNIFPFILGHFSFPNNATNFFIHSLNKFWKKILTGCWFSSVRCPTLYYHTWSQ